MPYGTLRSSRVEDTRLDQIVRWAGADFEGVIVFDEAHEMGGVAGGEAHAVAGGEEQRRRGLAAEHTPQTSLLRVVAGEASVNLQVSLMRVEGIIGIQATIQAQHRIHCGDTLPLFEARLVTRDTICQDAQVLAGKPATRAGQRALR